MSLKKYFISLFLLVSIQSYGQTIVFNVESGLGKFAMDDLRKMNTVKMATQKFTTQLTYDFPAYWYYQPSVGVLLGNTELGASCSYQSTGSRISAVDYSGEYRYDIKVNSLSPAAYANFKAAELGNMSMSMKFVMGVDFSNFKSTEMLTVLGENLKDERFNKNVSVAFAEPSIRFSYLCKGFNLSLNAGYHINTSDDSIEITTIEENMLGRFSKLSKYDIDWTGYRLGVSLSYSLSWR